MSYAFVRHSLGRSLFTHMHYDRLLCFDKSLGPFYIQCLTFVIVNHQEALSTERDLGAQSLLKRTDSIWTCASRGVVFDW